MDPGVVSLVCEGAGWHGDLVLLIGLWSVDLSEIVSSRGVLDDCSLVFGKVLVCLGG
jgi:hypothetical protein